MAMGTAVMNRETMRARLLTREPIGEIENDAGEEAGLGDAKRKAQARRSSFRPATKPMAVATRPQLIMMRAIQMRAPNLASARLLGTSKQDVAREEDAGAEAEHLRREAEVLVHGERGEADIDAVEEIDRVAEDEKRDQAPARLANGAFRGIPRHGCPLAAD